MIFDYNVVLDSLPLYFAGVLVTLKLLVIALVFGLALAVPLGLMRVSKQPVVNFPAWLYTYAIRGTPMLVQLYLLYYGLVDFFMGFVAGIKAFTAAVLGGIGSLPGAMLGGLAIGLIETFWSAYFSVEYKDVAAFSILIVVLIFMPTGLLGRPEVEKV